MNDPNHIKGNYEDWNFRMQQFVNQTTTPLKSLEDELNRFSNMHNVSRGAVENK